MGKRKKRKSNSQPWIIVAIILLFGLAGVWFVRSTQIVPAVISVDQAYQEYQDGAFFLDVRTPEEWNDYHVPGATLIPLDTLQARIDEVPDDQQIVVVCRSGNRSLQAREILLEAGYTKVSSVEGGLNAWWQAGYELVSGQE